MARGTRIPLFDVARQTQELRGDIDAAIGRVLDSGRFVLGAEVQAFEAEAAGFTGAAHAVGVASGTSALELALRAAGVGPGHAVLTTPFTFYATAGAVIAAGAVPVFADIDPATFNLALPRVEEALMGRSEVLNRLGIKASDIKAVVPVYLYGLSTGQREIAASAGRRGIAVVEDAAQAMGSTKPSKGKVLTCHSFYPTKNLGAAGDGGMVCTDDASMAKALRSLRDHGAAGRPYVHERHGTNSRLDEIQAAILRVKLKRLPGWLKARRAHAAAYTRGLSGIEAVATPGIPAGGVHSFNQYTLRVTGRPGRDGLQEALDAAGVDTRVYYPVPLHLQPALRRLGYRRGDFPAAESAAAEVLSLPMFPELTPGELDAVARAVRSAAG